MKAPKPDPDWIGAYRGCCPKIIVAIIVSPPNLPKSVYVPNLLLHVYRFPPAESSDGSRDTYQERNLSSELRIRGSAVWTDHNQGPRSNAPQGEETSLKMRRVPIG